MGITDGERTFMNGMRGKVRTYDASIHEYVIKLEGGGALVNLKKENLQLLKYQTVQLLFLDEQGVGSPGDASAPG